MSHEITNFAVDVIEKSHSVPVLVDFWAPWCGPCKVLGPVLERLAVNNKDWWVLAKVNTDGHQDIAAQYGIRGIPNVKLFVDGKVVSEFTGALPEHMVVQWLKKALPNKYRRDIERAEQLIRSGNVQEAQAVLGDILKHDSDNHHAQVLLAQMYVYSNPEKAVELAEGIEEHSGHFPRADAVLTIGTLMLKLKHPEGLPEDPVKQTYLEAARELSRNNYDSALGKFIEVMRTNRYYDEDGSRKACLAIFRTLGDDNEITLKHRRAFSNVLYV